MRRYSPGGRAVWPCDPGGQVRTFHSMVYSGVRKWHDKPHLIPFHDLHLLVLCLKCVDEGYLTHLGELALTHSKLPLHFITSILSLSLSPLPLPPSFTTFASSSWAFLMRSCRWDSLRISARCSRPSIASRRCCVRASRLSRASRI